MESDGENIFSVLVALFLLLLGVGLIILLCTILYYGVVETRDNLRDARVCAEIYPQSEEFARYSSQKSWNSHTCVKDDYLKCCRYIYNTSVVLEDWEEPVRITECKGFIR